MFTGVSVAYRKFLGMTNFIELQGFKAFEILNIPEFGRAAFKQCSGVPETLLTSHRKLGHHLIQESEDAILLSASVLGIPRAY